MKAAYTSLPAAYIGACILCGLFYLMVGFGKAIVGQYALILLAATILLAVSLIRNHGRASGFAKTIIGMIIISQAPIMFCWVLYYPGGRAVTALLLHSAFCILGIGCLVRGRTVKSGPANPRQA